MNGEPSNGMSADVSGALQLPCAHGDPIGSGALRTTPVRIIAVAVESP